MFFEDHIHIKLKSDIECILKSGALSEEQAANFKSDIINIEKLSVVQAAQNRPDKVYDVNVIRGGELYRIPMAYQ